MYKRQSQYYSSWHVHWYAYPLIYWMEIVADFLCLESGSIDILYITEIDPLWQDSELTAIINPEAVLFANPLALAACAADCVAATAKLPTDELFWCAGCQGTMYPLNGNVSATIGHVQASRLALARFSYKLHRELVAWGTMGSKGLCGKYLMPVMRKQQYRFQATNPNPQTKGRYACAPIGASTTFMSAGQVPPLARTWATWSGASGTAARERRDGAERKNVCNSASYSFRSSCWRSTGGCDATPPDGRSRGGRGSPRFAAFRRPASKQET